MRLQVESGGVAVSIAVGSEDSYKVANAAWVCGESSRDEESCRKKDSGSRTERQEVPEGRQEEIFDRGEAQEAHALVRCTRRG